MPSGEQKLLNAVQRPEVYREVAPRSAAGRIVLSVWDAPAGAPVVLFLPGTMTHPLFYGDFLDALGRAGLTVAGLHGQGHGKSPREGRPLTFASVLGNARDAVTWIRQTFPRRPLAVGSSQGSILVMALAGADRRDKSTAEYFYTDPAGRRSYPLRFMASLFTADLAGMRGGSITLPGHRDRCPRRPAVPARLHPRGFQPDRRPAQGAPRPRLRCAPCVQRGPHHRPATAAGAAPVGGIRRKGGPP